MKEAVIVSAVRRPIGSFYGSLSYAAYQHVQQPGSPVGRYQESGKRSRELAQLRQRTFGAPGKDRRTAGRVRGKAASAENPW